MPKTTIKEQLADALQRAEQESTQAHRHAVVLRYAVLGEPDAVERFSHDGDRVELRLYGATRCEGGYVLVITRFKSGDASTRVASLDEEHRYWSQWVPPTNCNDERIHMRDAMCRLYAARNRLVMVRYSDDQRLVTV